MNILLISTTDYYADTFSYEQKYHMCIMLRPINKCYGMVIFLAENVDKDVKELECVTYIQKETILLHTYCNREL